MKSISLIIIILSSYSIRAQEVLNPSGYGAWGSVEEQLSSTDKNELIEQLGISSPWKTGNDESIDLNLFHVLDINNDGLLDVAYSGMYAEGTATFFYLNKGSQYEQSDMIPGGIIRIERLPLSNFLEIKTHLRPCCAGSVHTHSIYLVHSKNNGIKITNLNNVDYYEDTLEPNQQIKKTRFVTTRPEYKLRATPEIDSELKNWREIIDGNTVAIYPKGSRGLAIAESTDETGRVWWFVIMDNNIKPIKSLIYYNDDPKGSQSMGWMSSRFVDKVD
ncbi:MAG: hypothetical protein ABJH98_12075 [Reichenbachiella sp.]|uniref:hypothetical protein n=1 Tax=Reichenbachiella sp. TaxID=2184521 RepID=UPI003297A5CE